MRFHHRAVPIVLTAVLIDTIGFGVVLPVLPDLVVHLGHVTLAEATRTAGYMLVAYAGAQFFAGPVMGNLGDRFGRRPVLLLSIIAFSALQGLVYPSMNALLSRMTDASHQGALQGGMSSIGSIAAIVAPVATTQALAFGAEHGEPGGGFLLAALLVFSALLVVVFGVVRRLKPVPEPAPESA